MKKIFNFYVYNWYKFTLPVVLIIITYLSITGISSLTPVRFLLVLSFIALLLHQFEEYILPGGAPLVINTAVFGEKKDATFFPGNMCSSMLVNNLAYIVYILAIVYPQCIWLGLGTIFFNFFQFLGHGIQMNKALKVFYNPGLITVIVFFIPISTCYIIWIIHMHLVTGLDWFYGFLCFIFILIITTIVPVQLLKSKTTGYVIPKWQEKRFKKIVAFMSILHNKNQDINH